ncbi:anaphase-promoting complex subunit 2-like isoform X1 [Hibiscus syriacus]|uniref:RING-type E3 ubiquitin transferase n=1 Tax=Hibiscus syriacus TaxID=106335 RepID=A0A6A3AEW1_HIBSY|nr:anaphase-promoting complex subunit 2-like isoform X1 [Hibiscus syriacus]
MAETTSYWCYRCNRLVRIPNEGSISCPDCDGGFMEEIDNHHHAASALHVNSVRFGSDAAAINNNIYMTPGTTSLRRIRMNGGGRHPFNPVIVLRLRQLPASMSEFLLDSGFDRLIDQLSQMEILNIGRYNQSPAWKAAVEAMPLVEIDDTHIHDELCCAVCKEQFELGTKVLNMPCNHLYHSNCILPWLQLQNSCPVCRHELPAALGEEGDGDLNSLDEVPMGLSIWRLPGGGFAVGRFSGGENREVPVVYTEMDGGFSGGGGLLPRRVSWRSRERGKEEGILEVLLQGEEAGFWILIMGEQEVEEDEEEHPRLPSLFNVFDLGIQSMSAMAV